MKRKREEKEEKRKKRKIINNNQISLPPLILNSSKISLNKTTLFAEDSQIFGDENIIFGNNNTINGRGNKVYGDGNTIRGWDTIVDGFKNTIRGDNTVLLSTPEKKKVISEMDILQRLSVQLSLAELILNVISGVQNNNNNEEEEEEDPHEYKMKVEEQLQMRDKRTYSTGECKVSKSEDTECVCCKVNQINTKMLDCNHCCLCTTCAIRIMNNGNKAQRTCPLCRMKIKKGITDLITIE